MCCHLDLGWGTESAGCPIPGRASDIQMSCAVISTWGGGRTRPGAPSQVERRTFKCHVLSSRPGVGDGLGRVPHPRSNVRLTAAVRPHLDLGWGTDVVAEDHPVSIPALIHFLNRSSPTTAIPRSSVPHPCPGSALSDFRVVSTRAGAGHPAHVAANGVPHPRSNVRLTAAVRRRLDLGWGTDVVAEDHPDSIPDLIHFLNRSSPTTAIPHSSVPHPCPARRERFAGRC